MNLIILALLALVTIFLLARNVFNIIFAMENYNMHKKRLKQLQFSKKKEEADVSDLIDKVTKPVILYVLPKLKPRNLDQLERDLRMAKWDKFFSPIQYRALSITLKVIGIVVGALLYSQSIPIAIVWAGLLIFLMDFLMRNTVKNIKSNLLRDFPDFIRITEGYLSANLTFADAVEESIKYVGEDWVPILKRFVVETRMSSISNALEGLKKDADLFEVREFISLINLTLEQGGDASESFTAQADKIREMQLDMIAMKIGKREIMSSIVQGPLLLCNILVIGLPAVSSMTSMTSM